MTSKVKNNKMVGWGTKKVKDWKEKYVSVERNAYNMAGVDDVDFSNLQKANPIPVEYEIPLFLGLN